MRCERLGFFQRFEAIQRRQQKSIGTVRVILQRGDGVRARAQPLRLEKGSRRVRDPDEPVIVATIAAFARAQRSLAERRTQSFSRSM